MSEFSDYIVNKKDIDLFLQIKQRNIARSKSAMYLLSKNKYITTKDNQTLMVYDQGYYHNTADPIVNSQLKELWGDQLNTTDLHEIVNAHLKPQTYIEREELNKDVRFTCIKNGLLNLDTGEIITHTPDIKFTFQLPITYDPQATCPKIDSFLADIVTDPTDIKTIYQTIAYCLYRGLPTHKVIVFLGGGRNGKSTLIELIKAFLGQDNVRGLSMHQLEHDQYALGFLYGKHANMNPDVGNKLIHTTGAIKKLTGDDSIDTNVKHKDYMHYKSFCKLIFASNELPRSDDTTYAWMSRWIFIKFPHVFDGSVCPHCHTTHEVNKELKAQLTTPEELSGLLNRVIKELAEMKANNWNFTLSEYVQNMEKEYTRLSDPVKAFVDDCIAEEDGNKVEKSEVYAAYAAYISEIGDVPMSVIHFPVRLKQHLPNIVETRTGNKKFWVGIKLMKGIEQGGLEFDNPDGFVSKRTMSEDRLF